MALIILGVKVVVLVHEVLMHWLAVVGFGLLAVPLFVHYWYSITFSSFASLSRQDVYGVFTIDVSFIVFSKLCSTYLVHLTADSFIVNGVLAVILPSRLVLMDISARVPAFDCLLVVSGFLIFINGSLILICNVMSCVKTQLGMAAFYYAKDHSSWFGYFMFSCIYD